MNVLVIGASPEVEAAVRRMLGKETRLMTLSEDGSAEAELVVVPASEATPAAVAQWKRRWPNVPILLLPEDPLTGLKIQKVPKNLARMTYREVTERVGRHVLREYLEALLIHHQGNVTKAALGAGLERESLHRLLRRYGIDGHSYRKPVGP